MLIAANVEGCGRGSGDCFFGKILSTFYTRVRGENVSKDNPKEALMKYKKAP